MKAIGSGRASRGALLGLLAVLACEKPAQEAPQDAAEAAADPGSVVLARVGDEVVTVEDLGFVPIRVSPSSRLEMLVMRKLAAAEARRRGLAEVPKTREKIAQFRRSELTWEEGLLRNALFNSIRLGMTFNEDELRAHYEAVKDRFVEPQWKLRVRKFADKAEARAAVKELGATGRLDPAQSEALGPLPANQLPPDIQPYLHQFTQPGDRLSLKLAGEWTVVELEAYLPTGALSFEAVRDKVDQDLRAVRAEAAINAELARLRVEQVVVDQAALAKLEKERTERVAARRAGNAPAEAAPAEAAPAEAAPTQAP